MTKIRTTSTLLLLTFCFLASPAAAQDVDCGDNDSTAKLTNYSLYWESFKNKDYESAKPYLDWMLACAPGFNGTKNDDDRNYERAVKMHQALADATEDDTAKRGHLDQALMLYDEAIPKLQEIGATIDENEWYRNKGRFIQKNAAVLDDMQNEVGPLYRTVFDGSPDLLSPTSYYVNVIVAHYAREGDQEEAVNFMESVESGYGSDNEVMEVVSGWRDRLFKDPEERMAFLEGQLEKKEGDVKIIEELLDIYEELEERDKLTGMLQQMIEVSPTPKVHIKSGVMKLNDGDPDGAIESFNAALAMEGGDAYAKEVQFNLGNAYREKGRLPQARRAYKNALSADPAFGKALIEIANVYAEAVRDCGGSKMEREDRAVYWLVADYLERARSQDSSVRNTANNALSQYRPYFPAAEDLFFKGWEEGDSYKIDYGCYSWINETTKVRKP